MRENKETWAEWLANVARVVAVLLAFFALAAATQMVGRIICPAY